MTDDATLELLLDLKHDLGKYLLLPLALLPKDADHAAVREALRRALLQTRTRTRRVAAGAGGATAGGESRHVGAAEIWRDAAAELTRSGLPDESRATIERAVERALAWEQALDDGAVALERAAIERDLGAVQSAIVQLIDEARRG